MVGHHLAAAMVAALLDALAYLVEGDMLLSVMNGGALRDVIDLSMTNTREFL
jgi:hypothetical protein